MNINDFREENKGDDDVRGIYFGFYSVCDDDNIIMLCVDVVFQF